MAILTWDGTGSRYFETGVDRGVLYPMGASTYDKGVAWNGLTTVTESPSGGEATKSYADNIAYMTLVSAEEFGGTIESFTYPPEFGVCDGTASPVLGVSVGQQARKQFGLSYRTKIGNDVAGQNLGYKIHVIWGCLATPSEKAYASINASPESTSFSWEFTTSGVVTSGYNPISLITIDSTKITPAKLTAIESKLYGTPTVEAALPTPAELITLATA